jgi:hypothetical protein
MLSEDVSDVSMLLFEAGRNGEQIGFRVKGNNGKWHVFGRRNLLANALWGDTDSARGQMGGSRTGFATDDYLLPAPQILIATLYSELIATKALTFARRPVPFYGRAMVNSEYEDPDEEIDPEGCLF